MLAGLRCVASSLCAFAGAAIRDYGLRMQLNTWIVSQTSTISTLSLNQKNSMPNSIAIAKKFNISNNDGSDGLNQTLKMSMAGNIKAADFNFRDQNSLFYDTDTTVDE